MRPTFLSESLLNRLKSWSLLSMVTLVLGAVLIGMLNVVNPLEIGPNGILLFFLAFYLFITSAVVMGFKAFRALFKRSPSSLKVMYLSAIIAFAPVMLLALNTLNQLEIIDLVLVVVFEGLALFYIFRRLE